MILNYRLSASVIVIFLFCGLRVFAGEGVLFSGPDAVNSDPCPAADRIDQLNFNKKILYIPSSEDQVRDLLGKISSSNQDEATRAIVSLALAGNLEAFTKLLNAQNTNGLSLYCSYYQNSNVFGHAHTSWVFADFADVSRFTHAFTWVPSPGVERTVSSPPNFSMRSFMPTNPKPPLSSLVPAS